MIGGVSIQQRGFVFRALLLWYLSTGAKVATTPSLGPLADR